MRRWFGLAALLIGVSMPGFAEESAPPIPEPSAVALVAADRLVSELPIENSWALREQVERRLSISAHEWVDRYHTDETSADLKRLFSLKVLEEVRRTWPLVIPAATHGLAKIYGRRLSVADLDATAEFFVSKPGKAYAAVAIAYDTQITALIVDQLNMIVAPRFLALLADAQATMSRMNAANRLIR